ncbi:hypothetical protein D3C86_1814870 [compost metagenome]
MIMSSFMIENLVVYLIKRLSLEKMEASNYFWEFLNCMTIGTMFLTRLKVIMLELN